MSMATVLAAMYSDGSTMLQRRVQPSSTRPRRVLWHPRHKEAPRPLARARPRHPAGRTPGPRARRRSCCGTSRTATPPSDVEDLDATAEGERVTFGDVRNFLEEEIGPITRSVAKHSADLTVLQMKMHEELGFIGPHTTGMTSKHQDQQREDDTFQETMKAIQTNATKQAQQHAHQNSLLHESLTAVIGEIPDTDGIAKAIGWANARCQAV
ncbi:unnamed protein product [Prorocentrum cordatum]|uniref:Uncharacterized protein n=1 Tax=Prorocentrum cordatum TaxID=2364126 RepID=A0ABN9UBI0_9DINO|nr:unnamed protein product [Polarella glacialis]